MRRQEGVTLSGFLVVAILVVLALLFGFKVGPSYFEYWTIQKQLKAVASDPAMRNATRREIEGAFVSRATIENITSIRPTDILVTKDGNQLVLSAEYSIKVPLFGNLSACMDFSPSSAKP